MQLLLKMNVGISGELKLKLFNNISQEEADLQMQKKTRRRRKRGLNMIDNNRSETTWNQPLEERPLVDVEEDQ